jgi:sialic acid synthase SpsE
MKILDLLDTYTPHDQALRRPYLLAEAGVNHEGKMELAKRLVDEAAEGGADGIKFQTYKADTIASVHSPAYWDTTKEPTKSQHELFRKYDKFWKNEFEELKRYCDGAGIEFMSTPFDVESARFLNDLMDVFKISSSDITNRPFIEFIAGFGKPILLSTGASYLHEIEEAVNWIEPFGNKLVLLHCVLNYPTEDVNAHLGMIKHMRQKFPDHLIGYSDHTLPKDMKALEVATLLGAVVLEKHFTFDKSLPGNDHYHAMDKEDTKLFRANLDRVFELLGHFRKVAFPSEEPARCNARRSLVAARAVPEGNIIVSDDLTWKRPAAGISPKFIGEIVGMSVARDVVADEVLHWDMLRRRT